MVDISVDNFVDIVTASPPNPCKPRHWWRAEGSGRKKRRKIKADKNRYESIPYVDIEKAIDLLLDS